MIDSESVTRWLADLKDGDPWAAQQLWNRYFQRLAALAEKRLRGVTVPADGEDVALSAMHSLWKGIQQGRFADLADRDSLWKLLVAITVRKASRAIRDEFRLKRGAGKLVGDSALIPKSMADAGVRGLETVLDREPTPEFATQMQEEMERLLDALPDDELRKIAIWKLNGLTSVEIAAQLGRALSTVERRLRLIRTYWAEASPE